jgi:hypothetical protein
MSSPRPSDQPPLQGIALTAIPQRNSTHARASNRLDDEQHVQPVQQHRVIHKEVRRDDVAGLCGEERPEAMRCSRHCRVT